MALVDHVSRPTVGQKKEANKLDEFHVFMTEFEINP